MRILAALPAALLMASALPAQHVEASACTEALAPADMKPVTVALVPELPDSLARLSRAVTAFTWAAADHIQALLGIDDSGRETSGIGWLDVGARVDLFVRANGGFSWTVPPEEAAAHRQGAALLDTALQRIGTATPHFFPAGMVRADSARWHLALRAPVVKRDGGIEPLTAPFAVPLAVVRMPWMEHVRPAGSFRVRFPDEARTAGVAATIHLAAVIDTTGRADSATVTDVMPAAAIPRDRTMRRYYDLFVQEARRGLLAGKFVPAAVGGCAVRERVTQPFNFSFR